MRVPSISRWTAYIIQHPKRAKPSSLARTSATYTPYCVTKPGKLLICYDTQPSSNVLVQFFACLIFQTRGRVHTLFGVMTAIFTGEKYRYSEVTAAYGNLLTRFWSPLNLDWIISRRGEKPRISNIRLCCTPPMRKPAWPGKYFECTNQGAMQPTWLLPYFTIRTSCK